MLKRIFVAGEHYLSWLWQITRKKHALPMQHKFVFNVLCFFELFYRFFFAINSLLRQWRGGRRVTGIAVISVGNLSIGGTGKSVVVSFLCKMLGCEHGAVVLRGYKRKQLNKPVLLVSNGTAGSTHCADAGDEACMLAEQLGIPVIVSSDRLRACQYFSEHFKNIFYVILDDAYQNYRMQKDVEILLLDARYPFENGHCLPAGRLREKDYTRADFIFLTHAQNFLPEEIQQIKTTLLCDVDPKKILTTRHIITDIFDDCGVEQEKNILARKRVLMVAGIGNPTSFIETIRDLGAEICDVIIFRDHYDYQKQDINKIINHAKDLEVDTIVTTEKDFIKIKPLISDVQNLTWYVPRVSIEFLSQEEYSFFELFLKRSIKIRRS